MGYTGSERVGWELEREREGAAALVQRLQFAARAERAERRKGGNSSAYTASLTKQIVIK